MLTRSFGTPILLALTFTLYDTHSAHLTRRILAQQTYLGTYWNLDHAFNPADLDVPADIFRMQSTHCHYFRCLAEE